MDVLIAPLYFYAAHAFLAIVPTIALIIVLVNVARSPAAISRMRRITVFLIVATILNLIFGHWAAVNLIHAFGASGQAVVTDRYATGTVYNSRRVYGHHVLLRLADGTTRESSFRTDTFNIYPWHNAVTYPGTGDRFNIRYLPHFPAAFIILTNDDSPWALGSRCGDLEAEAERTSTAADFAPSDAKYRAQAVDAIQKFLQSPCASDAGVREHYQQLVQDLQERH